MNESCTAPECGKDATQILIWRPGQQMILDGGLSAVGRCSDHPADDLRAQIAAADPDAVFWVMWRPDSAPMVPGYYTLSQFG